jgi:tetratricopeptide (TPR) repeat protein
MKEIAEIKFDKMVKESFWQILKPLGFKRKGNKFYLKMEDLGQLISFQKSNHNSQGHIHFTINVGIFVPECFQAMYAKIPDEFPSIQHCLFQERIGILKTQFDTWYDIKEDTDEAKLIIEMKENLLDFILPYFEKAKKLEDLMSYIKKNEASMSKKPILIIYDKLEYFEKAKKIYEQMLETKSEFYSEILRKFESKYVLGK